MSGTPITQVRDGIYLINVVARANDEQRVLAFDPALAATAAPRRAHRSLEPDRHLRLRPGISADLAARPRSTLTVQADVRDGATPEGAVASLEPAIEKLEADLPAGYHIATGGTVEESAQSQASVFALLPAALSLMLLFLMMQLHSFGRVALVVATVPLGLIGIVLALIISNRPLEFVAILGILALVGMIAPKRRHPHRPDRDRADAGARHLGRCGRGDPLPLPPDHADGNLDRARPHPDRADGVLGRPVRRHDADAIGAAGLLHHALSGEAAYRGTAATA